MAAAPPARGSIIYDNFGPGDSVGATSWNVTRPMAVQFTVGPVAMRFDSITVMLGFGNGGTTTLALTEDQSGAPGSVLESGVFTPPTGTLRLQTISSVARPLLLPGQSYWIIDSPSAGSSHGWTQNSQGVFGFSVLTANGWTTSSGLSPALRVNGTPSPVPEPSALLMGGTALAALSGRRLARRRKGR